MARLFDRGVGVGQIDGVGFSMAEFPGCAVVVGWVHVGRPLALVATEPKARLTSGGNRVGELWWFLGRG